MLLKNRTKVYEFQAQSLRFRQVYTMLLHKIVRWVLIVLPIILLGLLYWETFIFASIAFFSLTMVNLVTSYVVHEVGHLLALYYLYKGPLRLEDALTGITITPLEKIAKKRYQIIIALSGPLLCVAIGCVMLAAVSLFHITNFIFLFNMYIYFGHLVFLLPIFGDGQAIIIAILRSMVGDAT